MGNKIAHIVTILFTANIIGYMILRFYMLFNVPLFSVPLNLDLGFIGGILFVLWANRLNLEFSKEKS
jgi:hypothetical protein